MGEQIEFERFDRLRDGIVETGGRAGSLFHVKGAGDYRVACGTIRANVGGEVERGLRPSNQRECLACHLIEEDEDLRPGDLAEGCPVCDWEPQLPTAWQSWDERDRRAGLRGLVLDHLEEEHGGRL